MRPVQRDKESTRERIVESAMEAFARDGYHRTSMDDIVRRAGLSKGAIYFHFPSKESLFFSLVETLADKLEASVRDSIDQVRGAATRVDAALGALLKMLSRHRRLARVVLLSAGGLGRSMDLRLMKFHERFAGLIKEYLDRAVADGSVPGMDTRLVAYAWLGAINEVVIHWLHSGDREPFEEMLPGLRTLLLRSIGLEAGAVAKSGSREGASSRKA